MQINEVINELNNLALSLDGPQPLIKWSVITVPHVIECDFICICLMRMDSALFNYGSVFTADDCRLAEFKEKVNNKIDELIGKQEIIRQEGEFFSLESFTAEKENSPAQMQPFYLRPLKARQETLGYIAIGSLKENAFLKYKLNLFDIFCNQLGLGLRSLLDKNMVLEQARLLEEARERVEEEKKKIEAIIQGMQEGLVLIDKDDAVMSVNKAAMQMLGLNEDYKAKSATDFILNILKKETAGKGLIKKDLIIEKPKKAFIRLNSAGITDASGGSLGRAVLLSDITKEKEVEQMKSDFVSAVSHELRTPLTSIREALALMAEEITGPVNEKQKRCLVVALEDTNRLTRIINNLLSLSRIEAGKAKTRRISVDLRQVASHLIASFEAYAKSKGVELASQIEDNAPALFADPDQLIQVLTNLIGNAMKFTPSGGKITIEARITTDKNTNDHELNSEAEQAIRGDSSRAKQAEFVVIRVKDTGPGISAEDQEKLFKKFGQLDTGLTRRPGGTGLGLVISKDIVERHRGKIWVESRPGQGSTFSFTIPVFAEDSEYIEIIQEKLDLAKESGEFLAVALLCPVRNDNATEESDGHLTDYLAQKCREIIVRKGDITTIYKKLYVLVVAPGANIQGIQRLIDRVREISKIAFKVRVAIYPDDGVTAEELFKKVTK